MNYAGVDIRKKYSVLCAIDELGKKVREGEWQATVKRVLRDSLPKNTINVVVFFSFSDFPFASLQLPGADSSIQRVNVHHSITGSIILAS